MIILSFVIYSLSMQVLTNRKDHLIDMTRYDYITGRLEHCINQSIIPCNDESISMWNTTHPDTTFTLKTDQQITEEGIDAYNTERK